MLWVSCLSVACCKNRRCSLPVQKTQVLFVCRKTADVSGRLPECCCLIFHSKTVAKRYSAVVPERKPSETAKSPSVICRAEQKTDDRTAPYGVLCPRISILPWGTGRITRLCVQTAAIYAASRPRAFVLLRETGCITRLCVQAAAIYAASCP